MNVSIVEFAESHERGDILYMARQMTSGRSDIQRVTDWERQGIDWIVYAAITSAGWSIGIRVAEAEALGFVRSQVGWSMAALAATLVLIVVCVWFMSGRLTRPIVRLTEGVRQVAEGSLHAQRVDVRTQDEIGDLAEGFNAMTGQLRSLLDRLTRERASSRDAVIFAMAKLAESRDGDTGQHIERICRYVELIARALAAERPEIDDKWIETVSVTAALHDIGKVGIPDAVLCKPGRLTADEKRIIQKHTTIGGDMLLALKQRWQEDTFLVTATQITFAHHEHWDGSGYPFGLSGEGIALAARLVAVADVYDALTAARVYKEAMDHDDAMRIIRESSGSHFDPQVVEACLAVEEQIKTTAGELRDAET